ncbi:hypothetical protein PL81_21415, partial [Streptomyces sp. RSD-27]
KEKKRKLKFLNLLVLRRWLMLMILIIIPLLIIRLDIPSDELIWLHKVKAPKFKVKDRYGEPERGE